MRQPYYLRISFHLKKNIQCNNEYILSNCEKKKIKMKLSIKRVIMKWNEKLGNSKKEKFYN